MSDAELTAWLSEGAAPQANSGDADLEAWLSEKSPVGTAAVAAPVVTAEVQGPPAGPVFNLKENTVEGRQLTPNKVLTQFARPPDPTIPQEPDLGGVADVGKVFSKAGSVVGQGAEAAGRWMTGVTLMEKAGLIKPGEPLIDPETAAVAAGFGSRAKSGPVRKGVGRLVSGAVTPGNALLGVGIGALPAGAAVAFSGLFTASQLADIAEQSPEFVDAVKKGNIDKAIELGIPLVGTGAMALAGGAHVAGAMLPSIRVGELLPGAYAQGPGAFFDMERPVSLTPASRIPELPEAHPILLVPGETVESAGARPVAAGERVVEKGKEITEEASQAAAARRVTRAGQQNLEADLAEIDARAIQKQLLFPNQLKEIAKRSADLARERAEAGVVPQPSGYSGEVHDMGGPKPIEKLNPPDHVFREAAEEFLGRPGSTVEGIAAAVQNIRELYGGLLGPDGKPVKIEVKTEDVPIASTQQVGDAWEITLPEYPPAYQIVHEVGHIAEGLGDKSAHAVHDNNLIMSDFLDRATAPPIKEAIVGPALTEGHEAAIDAYMKLEDVPFFHGTARGRGALIESQGFDASRFGERDRGPLAEPEYKGVYLTRDKGKAHNYYATSADRPTNDVLGGGDVVRVHVDESRLVPPQEWRLMHRQADINMLDANGNTGPRQAILDEQIRLAKEKGYIGVTTRGGEETIIFDPKDARPVRGLGDVPLEHPATDVLPEAPDSGLPFVEPKAGQPLKEPAAGPTAPRAATEFGMFGAPQIGKELAKLKVYPGEQMMETVQQIGDVAVKIGKTIDPTHGLAEGMLQTFRSSVGELNRIRDIMFQRAIESKAADVVARMSEDDRVAFVDHVRSGGDITGHPLEPLIRQYRELSDQNHAAIREMEPNLAYLENRISVLWKERPKATKAQMDEKVAAYRDHRGLLGNRYWKKHLQWESLRDGIDNGGIPRTTHLFDILMRDLENQTRFRTGNQIWKDGKEFDLRRFVEDGGEAPEDWLPMSLIDDSGEFSRGWITKEPNPTTPDGTKVPGSWYLEPNYHRVLSNYLSRDPFRFGLGSKLLEISNSSKAALLFVPGFHAANVALLDVGVMALSGKTLTGAYANSIWSGTFDPVRFVSEVAAAGIAGPGRLVQIGNEVRRYFNNRDEFLDSFGGKQMLEQFPELEADLAMLYPAGGRLGFREQYRKGFVNSMIEAYHTDQAGNPAGAAFRALMGFPEIAEWVGGPLFGRAIPQSKVAAWLWELQDIKTKYAKDYASGARNLQHDASNLWNSVENRYGMVDYDLRLWGRLFKGTMQGLFLSFGWRHGTAMMEVNAGWKSISAVGDWIADVFERTPDQRKISPGGVIDMKRSPGSKYKFVPKSPPKIPPEMAAFVKVGATIAIINSFIQRGHGEPWPMDTDTPMLDMFVGPRIGGLDDDGKPKRRRFFGSYGPSMFGLNTDPIRDTINGIAPNMKMPYEAIHNRKTYDHSQIYNENSPWVQKFAQGLLYSGFGAYPFIGGEHGGPILFQNVKKEYEESEEKTKLGKALDTARSTVWLGGGSVPKHYDQTAFEKAIDNLDRTSMPYSVSKEKGKERIDDATIRRRIAAGADPAETVAQLSAKRAKRVLAPSEKPHHERAYLRRTLREALELWQYATPAEKARFGPILESKVRDINTTVSGMGAVHTPTGMEKPHAWDDFNAAELPYWQDRFNNAMIEAALAKSQGVQ